MKSVISAIALAHEYFGLKPYCAGVKRLFLLKNLTIRLYKTFSKTLLRELRRLIGRLCNKISKQTKGRDFGAIQKKSKKSRTVPKKIGVKNHRGILSIDFTQLTLGVGGRGRARGGRGRRQV